MTLCLVSATFGSSPAKILEKSRQNGSFWRNRSLLRKNWAERAENVAEKGQDKIQPVRVNTAMISSLWRFCGQALGESAGRSSRL